ncbi:MAG: adenosylcobinamide-phosphate synthase CbiB [Haloferacaceae archaeon]
MTPIAGGVAGAAAVVLAAALDRVAAEPPASVHPVAWFGRAVTRADRRWTRPRLVGVAVAVLLPLGAAGVAAGVVAAAGRAHPAVAAVAAGLVLFSTTSLRMLLDAARDVVEASDADLDAARTELRALAGRDASALSAAEVRSAAVESAAENLADGLVAPLVVFTLLAPFSLPLAAAGAAWVKAVNTLDSVLGYRAKPVGWASARLDDAVMWVPARASAVLVAVAAGRPASLVAARRDARVPASPNSGWPMATLAAALDVCLEKPGHYTLHGGSELPSVGDARRGVRVVGHAGLLAFGLAACLLEVRAWL